MRVACVVVFGVQLQYPGFEPFEFVSARSEFGGGVERVGGTVACGGQAGEHRGCAFGLGDRISSGGRSFGQRGALVDHLPTLVGEGTATSGELLAFVLELGETTTAIE